MDNLWLLTTAQWQKMSDNPNEYFYVKQMILSGETVLIRNGIGEIFGNLSIDELGWVKIVITN